VQFGYRIRLTRGARHPLDVGELHKASDAVWRWSGDNGVMTRRAHWVLAFLAKAEARSAPSGWALALDAAIAMAAAIGAVLEVANRTLENTFVGPGGQIIIQPATVHAPATAIVTATLTALPLVARRLYPITAWLVIATAITAIALSHDAVIPPVASGTAVFAAYSAVLYSRHRNLAIAAVLVVATAVTGTFGDVLPRFPARLTAIVALAAATAAGLGIRELRRRLRDSSARLRRSAQEHQAATQRAVAAERARIAAELHDVVTHNVSVMVVQAGAARKVLAISPGDAEEALLAVEASGRTAMAELRSLLGLLSPAADGAGDEALRPQPGLEELHALIGRVSAAGLPVEFRVSGVPRPLPPGAGLTAYRVVQEALTNVLRHAGQARASVCLDWGAELVITVSDDGTGASGGPLGRGLLGLRERLSIYGGEIDAGSRPAGGWQLRAVMPLEHAP
jgi:signal transduction histidine kinase